MNDTTNDETEQLPEPVAEQTLETEAVTDGTEAVTDGTEAVTDGTEAAADATEAAADATESVSIAADEAPTTRPARTQENRASKARRKKPRAKGQHAARGGRPFERFIIVSWSGQREPVDTMYWAEATRNGNWVEVESLEALRTRREVVERLLETKNALVGLEFSFSYPAAFLEFLKAGDAKPAEQISMWRGLAQRVREDLKKNTEDGIRLWIDHIGAYREASLVQESPRPDRRQMRGPRGYRPSTPAAPEAHELRSTAERFRRTDLAILHAAKEHLRSALQIGYNRLTGRYEFNDPAARGRAALHGIAMLHQVIEARDDVAVWPFERPKAFTLVEVQSWIYTRGKTPKSDETRRQLAILEDAGWEIPTQIRDLAARNSDANAVLRSLIGMIQTEARVDRTHRPLRDYPNEFYNDPQVQLEGWYYGVGYRVARSADGVTTPTEQAEPIPEATPAAVAEPESIPSEAGPATE